MVTSTLKLGSKRANLSQGSTSESQEPTSIAPPVATTATSSTRRASAMAATVALYLTRGRRRKIRWERGLGAGIWINPLSIIEGANPAHVAHAHVEHAHVGHRRQRG